MRASRWPIRDLDANATEREIRRAYAHQLRARRPDDDAQKFAEFEHALAVARSRSELAGAARIAIGHAPQEQTADEFGAATRSAEPQVAESHTAILEI